MEEIKTLEDLKKSQIFKYDRYSKILDETQKILNKNSASFSDKDITDAPISPMLLDDCTQNVILSSEVISEYKKILPIINNPDTALEYGYLLVGRKIKTDSLDTAILIEYIFDISKRDNINNRSVEYDNEKLNKIVSSLSEVGCDFMCICHTHPLISKTENKTTIANYLDDETKNSECIRDAGLNLSLQDILGYISLYNQAKKYYPNVEFASTVIMYNGELAMFGIDSGNLVRYVNICDEETKQPLPVSSIEEYRNNKLK